MPIRRVKANQEFTDEEDVDLEQPPPTEPDMPEEEQVGDLEGEGGPGDGS